MTPQDLSDLAIPIGLFLVILVVLIGMDRKNQEREDDEAVHT